MHSNRIDAKHGDVASDVGTDEARGSAFTILELDLDVLRGRDHMGVGDDMTLLVIDPAGTTRREESTLSELHRKWRHEPPKVPP